MAGPLENPNHELFAQALAKGETSDRAFVLAGFKRNRGNATRLKAKESVKMRVEEILGRAAKRTELTVAGITDRLLRIADKGEELDEAPGLSVARAALMDAAKLNGLVVETTEKISRTPEERAARLEALKAERERISGGN